MTSTDTIRTVIEIVPDWEFKDDHITFGKVYLGHMNDARTAPEFRTIMLDALAAAAVRVLLEKGFDVHTDIQGSHFEAPGMWIEITDMELSERHEYEYDARNGVAENTLEASAEFVRSGGFESE